MNQPRRMLTAVGLGAAAGTALNLLAGDAAWLRALVDNFVHPVGQIWLRMLFMLVLPLLFAALVMGVGDLPLRSVGRIAAKTFAYTVVVSVIAVTIGVVLVNLLAPGEGLSPELRQAALHGSSIQAAAKPADTSAVALVIAIIPDNPLKAAASGDMIGWLAFSLFFGIGLALTPTAAVEKLRGAIAGLYDVMMRLVELVLGLAPIGVGALLFTMTSRLGLEVLAQLLAYVGVVLLALSVHMFVVYPISVRFFGGMRPIDFFRGARMAMLTAFSTSSSAATLPTALKVAEEMGLPRHVSRFVLTVGATMNQNGTALFEGVTVLFLAQLFDVSLSLPQQGLVMLISVLAGIGTAGVPAGSLPVIAMILGMLGIPPEGIGLILGVDRLLDMCRTTLNVTGDLAAAVYVARGEKESSAA